MISRAVKNLTA